jgi:hypothetical protein
MTIVISCIGDKEKGISCGYLELVYPEHQKSLKECPKCHGLLMIQNGIKKGFYK